jgi:opacity protein-like surface antigen
VALYTGFGRFVTSTTAPIATGWSDRCRVGLSPTERAHVFTAHAKAGYFYYNVNLKAAVSSPASAALESSHSRSDFLYGGGVGMTFIDHLNIRAEYEQFDLANYRNSTTLWLAAAWRF